MSELLKIYESVIKNEKEVVNMEKRVAEEVDRLTEKYQKQFNADELEELQDIMFSIALTSQHEAFQLGAKYFVKLLAECLLS